MATEITKPEVTANYIRIPVAARQSGDNIVTLTLSAKEGIKALYAVNRKVILTYLFAREKGWTMAKAKTWVGAHRRSMEQSIMDTPELTTRRFQFEIPLLKTKEKIVKDENGFETKERFVEGTASSTNVDLQGDQMAESAIRSMAESINRHIILLNAEHDKSWQSELGEITKLDTIAKGDDFDLILEAKLDKTSKASDLWYALTEKQKKLGLSIGGYVKEYEMEQTTSDEDGSPEWRRVFKEIELDHVAVTSSPANPKTWVTAIQKSLTEEEIMEKAVWTTAYINNLPDSSFAYISPGGKKDSGGKTVPRGLRHLPYKDASGKVDLAHVRNALARLPQTNIPAAAKAAALRKLTAAARAAGVKVSPKSLIEGFEERFSEMTEDERELLLLKFFAEKTEDEAEALVTEFFTERGEQIMKTSPLKTEKEVEEVIDEIKNAVDESEASETVASENGDGEETSVEAEVPAEGAEEVAEEKPEGETEAAEEAPEGKDEAKEEAKSVEPEEEKPAEEDAEAEPKETPEAESSEAKDSEESEADSGEVVEASSEDSDKVSEESEEVPEDGKASEEVEETPEAEGEKPAAEEGTEEAGDSKEASLATRLREIAEELGTEKKSLEEPQGISEFKKTLDGISDTVKSISDAQEALAKRVGDLEDAPAGRKTTAVGKGIGATEVAPEKTLDEALKEAEKQYVNSPNLFAIKQRIRREYKDKGWE